METGERLRRCDVTARLPPRPERQTALQQVPVEELHLPGSHLVLSGDGELQFVLPDLRVPAVPSDHQCCRGAHGGAGTSGHHNL